MPRYVCLKPLPDGQLPGDVFEIAAAFGNVFLAVGAVRLATEADVPETDRPKKRTYRRRDLQPEQP
jgi:hypothetical protein